MISIKDMVEYHLKKEPIVYIYNEKDKVPLYIVKSILRKNQSYNCVKENDVWYCDCHSFKYRSGVDPKGHCKHIRLILFLIENNVEIKEV